MLTVAKTCRRLYTTTVPQFYAITDVAFRECTSPSDMPSIFGAFIKQIGPANVLYITKVSLRGSPPTKEIALFTQLPQLRRLCITFQDNMTQSEGVYKFCDCLRDLRSDMVLSLRSLHVEFHRWFPEYSRSNPSFVYDYYEQYEFMTELENTIDDLRSMLRGEEGKIEVELLESTFRRGPHKSTWKYVSHGLYIGIQEI